MSPRGNLQEQAWHIPVRTPSWRSRPVAREQECYGSHLQRGEATAYLPWLGSTQRCIYKYITQAVPDYTLVCVVRIRALTPFCEPCSTTEQPHERTWCSSGTLWTMVRIRAYEIPRLVSQSIYYQCPLILYKYAFRTYYKMQHFTCQIARG